MAFPNTIKLPQVVKHVNGIATNSEKEKNYMEEKNYERASSDLSENRIRCRGKQQKRFGKRTKYSVPHWNPKNNTTCQGTPKIGASVSVHISSQNLQIVQKIPVFSKYVFLKLAAQPQLHATAGVLASLFAKCDTQIRSLT